MQLGITHHAQKQVKSTISLFFWQNFALELYLLIFYAVILEGQDRKVFEA